MKRFCIPLMLLVACRGAGQDTGVTDDTGPVAVDDTGGDTDTNVDPLRCEAELVTLDPSEDERDVPLSATVRAVFSAPVHDGEWTLAMDGVAGQAELSTDGREAVFIPDDALDIEQRYTVEYEVCDQHGTIDFRTVSGPLGPDALNGHTFAIPWADFVWVSPPGAALFASQMAWFESVLVQVIETDPSSQTIVMAGAVGIEDDFGATVQAPCVDTLDYGERDFSANPVFQVGPSDLVVPTEWGDVTLSDLFVEATFADGGDLIRDVELQATLDTRSLDAMVGQDICALLSTIADVCEACEDGADKCLPVHLMADEGVWVPGLDLDLDYGPANDAECTL